MDAAELIATALAAGAAAGAENVAATAVKDTYQKLKQLLAVRFSGKKAAEVALAEHQAAPGASHAPLKKALSETGADTDRAVIDVAQQLMNLLDKGGSTAGQYTAIVRLSRRPRTGARTPQVNRYPAQGPPHSDDRKLSRLRADQQRSTQTSAPALTSPSRSSVPRTRDPDRVILIEGSSGVQVGKHNYQYSAYEVTLPTVALESAQALADRLLSPDAPWAGDVFSHNAQPDLSDATGGLGSASSGIVEGPGGDTLVIVRSSQGVQIGDHNTQRNQFRIRVATVRVQADQVGVASARRAAYIARLRKNPSDWDAAHSLAEDIANAARTDLHVDMTAQVTRVVDHPQIPSWSGEYHNLTGRQLGGPNRARVRVHATINKFDTRALTRKILNRAADLYSPPAVHDAPRQVRITDVSRTRNRPNYPPSPGMGRGF